MHKQEIKEYNLTNGEWKTIVASFVSDKTEFEACLKSLSISPQKIENEYVYRYLYDEGGDRRTSGKSSSIEAENMLIEIFPDARRPENNFGKNYDIEVICNVELLKLLALQKYPSADAKASLQKDGEFLRSIKKQTVGSMQQVLKNGNYEYIIGMAVHLEDIKIYIVPMFCVDDEVTKAKESNIDSRKIKLRPQHNNKNKEHSKYEGCILFRDCKDFYIGNLTDMKGNNLMGYLIKAHKIGKDFLNRNI